VGLTDPLPESLHSLQFSMETRRFWHGIGGILDSRRHRFGDRTLDRRLILRCNDSLLPHELRRFEEFRESVEAASGRSGRGWKVLFSDGTLRATVGFLSMDDALIGDLEALVGLLCNVVDILRFHSSAAR
jgi:hypothetical protein